MRVHWRGSLVQSDGFVLFFRHGPPHRYWSGDRAVILDTLKAGLAALGVAVTVETVVSSADYHAAQLNGGAEDSVAHPGSMRKLVAALVSTPVLFAHVGRPRHAAAGTTTTFNNDAARLAVAAAAGGGSGGGADGAGVEEAKAPEPTAAVVFGNAVADGGEVPGGAGAPRVFVVTASHVVEMSARGDQVLFKRPLTDVATVVLHGLAPATGAESDGSGSSGVGAFSLTFHSDGRVKRFVALPAVDMRCGVAGSTVLTSGVAAYPALDMWAVGDCPVLAKGGCAADVVAEVIASNVVSCARALGAEVDVLTEV